MLDDILDFAVLTLVDNARLSFWMPTANEADQEIQIPSHPSLQLVSVCTQEFNRCKTPSTQQFGILLTTTQGQEDLSHTDESQMPMWWLVQLVLNEPRRTV